MLCLPCTWETEPAWTMQIWCVHTHRQKSQDIHHLTKILRYWHYPGSTAYPIGVCHTMTNGAKEAQAYWQICGKRLGPWTYSDTSCHKQIHYPHVGNVHMAMPWDQPKCSSICVSCGIIVRTTLLKKRREKSNLLGNQSGTERSTKTNGLNGSQSLASGFKPVY